MNLVVLQESSNRGWVLTYNGNYIRSFERFDDWWRYFVRNPDEWEENVTIQIIGSMQRMLRVS